MPAKAAEYGADLVGANCGIGPAELLHSVRGMLPVVDVPVIAKGNCGIPAYVDGGIHYHGTPELMADYACFARDSGITVIGGCCGTTPDHIAAMAAALDRHQSGPLMPWPRMPRSGTVEGCPGRTRGGASRRERGRRRRRD